VAGASEGLGAAFATALASRGLHLLLLARRPAPLERLAAFLFARVLPRRLAIRTMERATRRLYEGRSR
jgi:NADP-dependent 3-hydroxy acid dehydrogenase YdfG